MCVSIAVYLCLFNLSLVVKSSYSFFFFSFLCNAIGQHKKRNFHPRAIPEIIRNASLILDTSVHTGSQLANSPLSFWHARQVYFYSLSISLMFHVFSLAHALKSSILLSAQQRHMLKIIPTSWITATPPATAIK